MRTYRLSIWTGRSCVELVAKRLRQAGIRVESLEETEVIVRATASSPPDAVQNIRVVLVRHFKTHFGLHPIVIESSAEPAPASR